VKYAHSALHELSHSTTMTQLMRLDRTHFPSQSNSLETCSEAPLIIHDPRRFCGNESAPLAVAAILLRSAHEAPSG